MSIKTTLIIGLSVLFSACHYADMGGMVVTGESVNERVEQSLSFNSTHAITELTVSKDDYSICTMGDSHIGGTTNFDAFLSQAKNMKTAAVVLDGDICSGNAVDYDMLEQHLLSPDSLKTFFVAGNHDLYFGGWKEFYSRFGSSTYYFTIKTPTGSDLFICLDSGSGTLGSKQLDWFKNVLENVRPAHRHCIIFTHNNLYRIRRTLSTNPVEEELVVLTELFAKHRVDMVITGHDHVKNVFLLGKTTHITMNALLDGFPNPGFVKVTIKNGVIDYQFIDI